MTRDMATAMNLSRLRGLMRLEDFIAAAGTARRSTWRISISQQLFASVSRGSSAGRSWRLHCGMRSFVRRCVSRAGDPLAIEAFRASGRLNHEAELFPDWGLLSLHHHVSKGVCCMHAECHTAL